MSGDLRPRFDFSPKRHGCGLAKPIPTSGWRIRCPLRCPRSQRLTRPPPVFAQQCGFMGLRRLHQIQEHARHVAQGARWHWHIAAVVPLAQIPPARADMPFVTPRPQSQTGSGDSWALRQSTRSRADDGGSNMRKGAPLSCAHWTRWCITEARTADNHLQCGDVPPSSTPQSTARSVAGTCITFAIQARAQAATSSSVKPSGSRCPRCTTARVAKAMGKPCTPTWLMPQPSSPGTH